MNSDPIRVEECCSWCRHPISYCTDISCDETKTYQGVLMQGQWRETTAPPPRRTPPTQEKPRYAYV